MLLNPIVGNLHNTTTNRFHPIIFRESPLPGPPSADKPIRHKSKGHHTNGFDSREEAIQECHSIKEKIDAESHSKEARLCIQADFPWDGETTPALVVFFVEQDDGSLIPM